MRAGTQGQNRDRMASPCTQWRIGSGVRAGRFIVGESGYDIGGAFDGGAVESESVWDGVRGLEGGER